MAKGRIRSMPRRRKIVLFGGVSVAAVALAVLLVYLFVWRSDAPPPPSVLQRSEALTATTAVATEAADPPPSPEPAQAEPPAPAQTAAEPPPPAAPVPPNSPPATESVASPPAEPPPSSEAPAPSPPAADPPAATTSEAPETGAANLDGVWSVNTELGSFEDYSSSWAGYRVGEELSGIGTTDAVGRTAAVSGTLEIAGSTVTAATVEVDLTTVISDRPRRDGLVRRSLNTDQYPLARFELSEPISFDRLPEVGASVTATVAGTFSVHGASRPVQVALEATWVEGIVIVGGTFQILFEDYGIVPPSAPVVLSVEEIATIELLLNFTR